MSYISKRLDNKESSSYDTHFEIKELKCKLKNNNETIDARTELSSLIQNGTNNIGISKGKRKHIAGDFSRRNRKSNSARPIFRHKAS